MVSRCFASYGRNIQAVVAGGVLAFGDRMGGLGEQFAKLMSERLAASGATPAIEDEALGAEARVTVRLLTPPGIPLTRPLSALKVGEQETPLTRGGNRFMFPMRTLSGIDAPKADSRDVAVAARDGIEAAAHEVLADDTARWIKSQLSADLEAMYAQLQK